MKPRLALTTNGGADEDVQLALAVETKVAEAAGVRPANHRLQFVDDLHRTNLGRAGDAAAGKARGQRLQVRDARAQSAGYGRDQMLHLSEPLQLGQVRYRHRSVFTKPAKVIAQQVGDHHQFGAFLVARLQLVAKPRVEIGSGAARSRALNRPSGYLASAQLQKLFRRRAGQLEIATLHERRKRRGRRRGQALEKRPAIEVCCRSQPMCEVGLINVALPNVVDDPPHPSAVLAAREGGGDLVRFRLAKRGRSRLRLAKRGEVFGPKLDGGLCALGASAALLIQPG